MNRLKTLLAAMLATVALTAHADGGMWFLHLMEQQHLADSLKRAGLKMPVKQLYNPAGPSLRDCVGQFGGGCTGEIISPDGLVLTNNHCGYSYVHSMSTLETNYLKDGYFAHSRAEELPVPGLTFTFVLDVQDVTDSVKAAAQAAGVDEYSMQSGIFLSPLSDRMHEASKWAGTPGASSDIEVYYGGNRFYLITTQRYKDVRLVVNPPLNVAQFGGDGDNWVWPRHNPDFAIFRVYADSLGNPADYAAANTPLHRDRHLPISLRGYEEGDFAMIMGFPGSTERYLCASSLERQMKSFYTPVVLAGEPLLEWERAEMAKNDSIRLAMQDDHMGIQNAVKNFGGAVKAVEKLGLVEKRRAIDAQVTAYGKRVGNEDYATVVTRLDSLNARSADATFDAVLSNRTLPYHPYGRGFNAPLAFDYLRAVRSGNKAEADSVGRELVESCPLNLPDGNIEQIDSRLSVLIPVLHAHAKSEALRNLEVPDMRTLLAQSLFFNKDSISRVVAEADTARLLADPLFRFGNDLKAVMAPLYSIVMTSESESSNLKRIYEAAYHDMTGWQKAPDANFTQRLSYGHVKPYSPRDAVKYDYKTTLGGMFEKENADDPDYEVNPRVRELYNAGNFGRYANRDGVLQTDFLTDNDITGGNSGSPVLNARGELIGVAFDGNIESLSSDYEYNPSLQRCINADIRYVLWTVDIFGGSTYLLDELTLRK